MLWATIVFTALAPSGRVGCKHFAAPQLFTHRNRVRDITATSGDDSPTANADDLFAGMQSPIPLDSPEGREALARMKMDAAPSEDVADDIPTANAADLFAGMETPIPLDSPEGQAMLSRMDADKSADAAEAAEPEPSGLTGAKVRELLDAGLGDEQVKQLLAAEGVAPALIDSLFEEAVAVAASAPAPPVAAPVPPVVKSPPPAAPVASSKPTVATVPIATAIKSEKLYPMPEVSAEQSQVQLPFLPFGIARGAFVISSVASIAILGLLLYLLSLTG